MALPIPLQAASLDVAFQWPISPAELGRWQRFAAKGGIGQAVATRDQEQVDDRDLMFLEGDEITLLLDLGDHIYLGSCEEVIGVLPLEAVQLTSAKLRRPVLSTRPSSASPQMPSPQPPPPPSAHSSPKSQDFAGKAPPTKAPQSSEGKSEPLEERSVAGSAADEAKRRRRTNVAGLGLGIENVEQRVQGSPKPFWREDAPSRLAASALPGAFVAIPFPRSPSSSISTTNTPSLVTSPSSDFECSGSSNGHDTLTPPVPAWNPNIFIRDESPPRHYLSTISPHSSDEPTDKFPFPIESFPMPGPRLHSTGRPSSNPLPRHAHPALAQSTARAFPPSPPQPLRSQFSDASLATTSSRYKISDGPSIDEMPLLPSTFSSPSSNHPSFTRMPKTSDASWNSDTSNGSAPATPGEDHTLAMIFDSYRYSISSNTTVHRTGSATPESGARGGLQSDAETERDDEEVLDFESPVRQRSLGPSAQASPFRFGAASDLRVRMEASRGGSGGEKEEVEHMAPPRFSTDSFDMANIPRLSTIFPRSSTVDSLASIRSSQSTISRSPPSETIPIEDATAELDAARRLFSSHFSGPQDYAGTPRALATSPPPSDALPDSPTRTRLPNPRRKSIKGLTISSPVTGAGAGVPIWRAASNSPVHVTTPVDVFGSTPSSAASLVPSPMSTTSSSSSSHSTPTVTVQGASPAPPRRRLDYSSQDSARTYFDDPEAPQLRGQWRPKLTMASSNGEPAQYALHPTNAPTAANGSSSPSPNSPRAANSNSSSPSTSSFNEEWRAPGRERERSATSSLRETSLPPPAAKLRKPNLRLKMQQQQVQTFNISSPISVDMCPSLSSASLSSIAGGSDVFSSPPPPPTPSQLPSSPRRLNHKSSKGLFTRKPSRTDASTVTPSNGGFPSSKGISSKDFEDETIKLKEGHFEMVKPLRDALQGDDELEELKSPSSTVGRPSMAVSSRSYEDSGSSEGGHAGDVRSAASSFSPPTGSVENHRANELQWVKLLGSSSGAASLRKSKKVRALVHAGIPSSVRGRVWCSLAGVEDVKIEGFYQTLCDMPRIPLYDEIEEDLARTLHDHPQFAADSAGRAELGSVLKAFVRYDQELGYWPGLGFVGGLILSQVGDGELAFWSLVSLLQNDVSVFKHDMRQFFPAGHEELRIATLAFGFVLEQSESKLAKRFLELGVDPSQFYTRWFPFFVNTLPWASTLRVMDLILYDSSYKLRVALAILDLSHLDDATLFPTRESVLHWLHHLPPPSFSPALLLPTVHTIRLREDRVKKAYKKAEATIRKGAK